MDPVDFVYTRECRSAHPAGMKITEFVTKFGRANKLINPCQTVLGTQSFRPGDWFDHLDSQLGHRHPHAAAFGLFVGQTVDRGVGF